MESVNCRRSAFAEAQRVNGEPTARRRKPSFNPKSARQDEEPAGKDLERGADRLAVRDQPARERENERRNDCGAQKRDTQPEQERSAECIRQTLDRGASESCVEQLHRRNGDGSSDGGSDGKGDTCPPRQCGPSYSKTVGVA
jgi:hypothetical protein